MFLSSKPCSSSRLMKRLRLTAGFKQSVRHRCSCLASRRSLAALDAYAAEYFKQGTGPASDRLRRFAGSVPAVRQLDLVRKLGLASPLRYAVFNAAPADAVCIVRQRLEALHVRLQEVLP
jgi:hypothetical protein